MSAAEERRPALLELVAVDLASGDALLQDGQGARPSGLLPPLPISRPTAEPHHDGDHEAQNVTMVKIITNHPPQPQQSGPQYISNLLQTRFSPRRVR